MDIDGMIAELREERECLDQALISLERLANKRTPRRGRPRKWLRAAVIAEPKKLNGSTNDRAYAASASSGH